MDIPLKINILFYFISTGINPVYKIDARVVVFNCFFTTSPEEELIVKYVRYTYLFCELSQKRGLYTKIKKLM